MTDRLTDLRRAAADEGIPVLREQTFSLLTVVTAATKPKRILEVGTAYGCSGIGMLTASPVSRLVTLEIDDRAVIKAKNNFKDFGLSDRVELFEGDASEIIPVLSGKFDLIFLDGPKGHYLEYLPFLKDLLTVGGVLFADNVLLKEYALGEPERRGRTAKRNMAAFTEAVLNDGDFIARKIDLEDGVLIAVKIR